jgi:hypothetical protein
MMVKLKVQDEASTIYFYEGVNVAKELKKGHDVIME